MGCYEDAPGILWDAIGNNEKELYIMRYCSQAKMYGMLPHTEICSLPPEFVVLLADFCMSVLQKTIRVNSEGFGE